MHDAPEVKVRVRGKATALSPRAASACARMRAAAAPLAVSARTRAHATPSARHAPQPARSLPRLSKARLKRVSSRPVCLGSASLGLEACGIPPRQRDPRQLRARHGEAPQLLRRRPQLAPRLQWLGLGC